MTEFKTNIDSVLYVWSRLEQARDNLDPLYGDETEIYVQHLLPDDLDYQSKDIWVQAGKALYTIIRGFCERNKVTAFVDGEEIGDWMNDFAFFHKVDVRIAK
jgi:hypothetical protein